MKAYKLVDGAFVEVEDPTDVHADGDVDAAIAKAGYLAEISTRLENVVGADAVVYARDAAPRYYIDLMGQNHGIAAVVADDFPALVKTLKELHPLLTLIAADQSSTIHLLNEAERE